jgi:SHAQKYF class myb-like DNA-binding protein
MPRLQSNYSEGLSPQGAHSDAESKKTGRWSMDEHFRFIEALQLYGKEWKRVQQHVGSRSSTQARSHAQKFFVKLEKRGQRLEDFLSTLDLEQVRNRMLEAGSDQDYEDPENYCCVKTDSNTIKDPTGR